MNFIQPQLIALDLDGTALRDDHTSISPRLEAALLRACAEGIHVVPTTGRQYRLLPPCIPGAAWARFAVLCDGAEVRELNGGRLLTSCYLSPQDFAQAHAALTALKAPMELSCGGELYLSPEDLALVPTLPVTDFHRDVLRSHGIAVADLIAFANNPAHQIDKINLPYIAPHQRQAVEQLCASLPLSCVWSGPSGIEVTHRQATKEAGLRFICKELGVELSHVLAIGDSGNDITMLRAVGLGVAMGNAPQEVKAVADAVTASNMEDGAALAVERYALNRL